MFHTDLPFSGYGVLRNLVLARCLFFLHLVNVYVTPYQCSFSALSPLRESTCYATGHYCCGPVSFFFIQSQCLFFYFFDVSFSSQLFETGFIVIWTVSEVKSFAEKRKRKHPFVNSTIKSNQTPFRLYVSLFDVTLLT